MQDFYIEELRMATEHPLLDDNGDKRGTPPDWYRGTRATKRAEGGATTDGVHAHRIALVPSAAERALTPEQRVARNQLEDELERLRARKADMPERDYLRESGDPAAQNFRDLSHRAATRRRRSPPGSPRRGKASRRPRAGFVRRRDPDALTRDKPPPRPVLARA